MNSKAEQASFWVRLILETGANVVRAIQNGDRAATVWDVLPDEYKDDATIAALEARAAEDYLPG